MSFLQTYKSEYKELFRLGSPLLLSQLGVILLAFTDTIMVGRYGVNELAASAFVNSIYLIPNVMLMGLSGGITPLIGALFSKEDYHAAGRITRGSMQINLAVAALYTAIMAGIYFLLPYFGQPPELLDLIQNYYLILMMVAIPMSAYNVLMQTSNGITCTSVPMYATVFSICINIIFNYLLIYGKFGFPELGLAGAGIATVMARVVCFLLMYLAFRHMHRYQPYQEGFNNGKGLDKVRRTVWTTSWPVMIQNGLECSLWSIGAVVVGWYGAIQLAAYQVVNTIGQLGFMIYISFAAALAIRVANFTGLKDEKGARKATQAGIHINMVLATGASLVFIFAAKWLINIFIETGPNASDGNAVVISALGLVAPLVVYQYMDALQLTCCNAIRGTSNVRPLMHISLWSYIIVGIPMLLLFASCFGLGNVGAYWSFCIVLLVAAVMAVYYFRKSVAEIAKL